MAEGYKRTALFRSRKAISCADATTVDGFRIIGRQPTDTDRRVVFSYSDVADSPEYFKLTVSGGVGTPAVVTTQAITEDSVLAEGNTMAELAEVTSVPDFVGKEVYVVAALSMPEEATVAPTLGIGIIQTAGADLYEKTEESAVYELSDEMDVTIIHVSAQTSTTGSGSVAVDVRFKNGETWGEYMTVEAANAQSISARAFQFRARYAVNTLEGADTAKVTRATVTHRVGNVGTLSEGTAVMVTQTYDFVNTMTRAHLMIKRNIVPDTNVSAQISLRKKPTTVSGELLATGTGAQQTVVLANTRELASHGFALYFDGVVQNASSYAYSPNDGQVTFNAPAGVAVTADYIYDWEDEHYVDFVRDTVYPDKEDPTLVDEQFDYSATDPSDPVGSVGAVRVLLEQLTGTETNVPLGTGTGAMQAFQLAHHAKLDTIEISPAGASWRYDDDNDVVKVIAGVGEPISISYDWVGRPASIDSIVCIFDE